jgi:hypothetical protein
VLSCPDVAGPEPRVELTTLLTALDDASTAAGLPAADAGLTQLARYHRLTPLLSAQQGQALPAALGEAFRRDRLMTAARNIKLGQVAEECGRALESSGIPAVVLKGLEYEARLYGLPGCRPTSDVDLLVPNDARRDAFRVLDGLGFEPRAAAPGFDDVDYHEVAWRRAEIEVDLHMALAPLARCRIDYRAIWRDAEPFRIGQTELRALARTHAAIFHGLHMAIDHFAVPAIYLVDLSRLLPDTADRERALDLAAEWHCRRPLATSVALTAAFLPSWSGDVAPSAIARRIIAAYGSTAPLPRTEQLVRKMLHFDTAGDAFRYVAVQSRRNLRGELERRVRRRSARERLGF